MNSNSKTLSSRVHHQRAKASVRARSNLLGLTLSICFLAAMPCLAAWDFTGSLTFGRAHHTATLLRSGQVLVVGGIIGSQQPAELYDPTTGQWSDTGSLSDDVAYHTATLLRDGRVLIAGGTSAVLGGDTTAASLYDPATGTFTPTGSMNTPRAVHTAVLLATGEVLVAGGFFDTSEVSASAEVFNPTTGQWENCG
jgi:hypothetical protein